MADDSRESYSPEMVRMWRVYRTVKEMCFDRGYEILEEDTTISLAEFASRTSREDGDPDRGRLNFSAMPSEEMIRKYSEVPTARDPNPPPAIGGFWVEFNGDDNPGLKQLRNFIDKLTKDNYHSGLLICKKPMTGMGLRLVRGSHSMLEPKGGLEVFVEQDLLVNITKHELVPKHVLLSREEKEQLLKRYRLKETQLPRIQVTDPVARYMGLRKGQVVKIIRKSETAGRYASYRWAI